MGMSGHSWGSRVWVGQKKRGGEAGIKGKKRKKRRAGV